MEEKDTKKIAVCDGGKTRLISKQKDFQLEKAANVEIKEPEWLVPGYIPKYGITTIAGDGGVGKTSIWCAIVAAITTGRAPFLLGNNAQYIGEPETVVVFSAEDSWNYVLKRRLMKNGANLEKILFMGPEDERFQMLNFNSELLKGIIDTNRPDLTIYDPVQAFVPENIKMGDRNSMRKCLSPLMGYGEVYKTTSIIIAHANKQSGVWGRKRIADSADIWDASRSVLMTGIVPNSDGMRYISHEKSNWGRLQDSVLFKLEEGKPIFQSYSKNKDREFVLMDSKFSKEVPAADTAKEFIISTLKEQEQEQMEISELDELAKSVGISNHSLKDAKSELNREKKIHTWSVGYGKNKKFFITLTDISKPDE